MGTLATWTGFWIGINLNAQLFQFLFRNKVHEICKKNLFMSCVSQASEKYGIRIMLLMRLSPIFLLNFIFQPMCLIGMSYKDFVIGGLSSVIPNLIIVY